MYVGWEESYSKCAGECPLKDAEQKFYKKPVITLVFKLKTLVICTKFGLCGGDI